jgi:hypothetical protein
MNGSHEIKILRNPNCSVARHYVAQNPGNKPGRDKAVRDAFFKERALGVFVIDMGRVYIARHPGEQINIRFGNRLSKGRLLPDKQIVDEIVH